MKNLLIKPTLNVKDALKQLNKVGGKCLVVVNKENKLFIVPLPTPKKLD